MALDIGGYMEAKIQIKITIAKGKEITLDEKEGKELYLKLHELFGSNNIQYVPYYPYWPQYTSSPRWIDNTDPIYPDPMKIWYKNTCGTISADNPIGPTIYNECGQRTFDIKL